MNNDLLLAIMSELVKQQKSDDSSKKEEPKKEEPKKEEPKKEEAPKEEKSKEEPQREEVKKAVEEVKDDAEEDRYAQLYRQVVADKLSAKLAKAGIDTDQAGSLVDFIDFDKLNADDGELSDDKVQSFIDTVSGVALRKPPVSPKKQDFSTKAEGLAKYLEEK